MTATGATIHPTAQARGARVHLCEATPADRAALVALQRLSLRTLGRGHYTGAQIESYLRHTETLEDYLVADGTYFVARMGGELAGCGGWSIKAPAYAAVTPSVDHQANRRPRRRPSARTSSSNAGSSDITSAGNRP